MAGLLEAFGGGGQDKADEDAERTHERVFVGLGPHAERRTALLADAELPLEILEAFHSVGAVDLRPAPLHLWVRRRAAPNEACRALPLKLEQLFECGQPVARAGGWVVAERDPLEFADVVDGLRAWRPLVVGRLPLDGLRDLRQPVVELAGDAPAVVEEIARLSSLIFETALVKITVNGLEDGHAAGSLVDGEALGGRKLERSSQVGRDLGRARLDQAGRVDALLGRVQVARVGRNEAFWIAALVHLAQLLSDRRSKT